jgi:hypothetical protein
MSLTVRYLDAPEGAQQAARASGNNAQSFSNFPGILSGASDTPYATLEPGVWVLDGTRRIMPDAPNDAGWWSASRSDANGRFSAPPQIVISFPAPYTATGLTFVFSPRTEQWCSEISLRWYNAQTLLKEVTAYPDNAQWVLDQTVESFDRIEISVNATNNPGQFAKVQLIQIGKVVVFGRNELTRVRLTNEVDPSLCVLSVDTMRVEIRDRNGRRFAPQENQRMELYRDEKLLAAHYIIDSSREAKDLYTFSCQSAIGLLSGDYLGGMYVDVPVKTFLAEVLDGRTYILDASFDSYKVNGYLPICTRREALQQLAFSMGAMVSTQGTDRIYLLPLPTLVSGSFTEKQIFMGAKAEMQPRIYRFEVSAHSYTKSSEVVTLMSNKEISGESELFTFYEPHYDYTIEGGTIVASGVNWVKITANGAVTLNAKTYIHNAAVYTKQNPFATAAERSNVFSVTEATLVHKGNVQAVLNRLYSVKQLRQTLSHDAVISEQRAGDIVSSVNPWGTRTSGYITSMESSLTQNGHTASVEILGEEVADS